MAELEIRRIRVETEEIHYQLGRRDNDGPLRLVAGCAVVRNPLAGQGDVENLAPIVEGPAVVGVEFGHRFQQALGAKVESYGKAGIPGMGAEQEHVHGALTSVKDEFWVRSPYDTVTVRVPGAPRPDELVIVAAVANRGCINARVGGMTHDEAVTKRDSS